MKIRFVIVLLAFCLMDSTTIYGCFPTLFACYDYQRAMGLYSVSCQYRG